MKMVYPEAFEFRLEKGLAHSRSRDSYQLTICHPQEDAHPSASTQPPPPSSLIDRRRRFNKNLERHVRKYHQEFLSSLDPPLRIEEDKVFKWHEAFPLESVPNVEPAMLPTPPSTGRCNLFSSEHITCWYFSLNSDSCDCKGGPAATNSSEVSERSQSGTD